MLGITITLRDSTAASLIKMMLKGYLVQDINVVVNVMENTGDTTMADVGSVVSMEQIGDDRRTACLKVGFNIIDCHKSLDVIIYFISC